MRTLLLAAPLLLLGSYYLLPLQWARLLLFAERTRSGLKAKRLTVDGRSFHYLEGGQGPCVVMLHGFGGDSDQWVPMARSLTGRFRLLVPDLPGFGRTSASASERFVLPLQAERLRSLLRALGIHRYHLVANSMGGNIAGLLAHDRPGEVESLTLLEPQGIESRIPTAMDLQIRRGQTPLIPAREGEFDRLVDLAFVKRPFIPRAIYRYLRRQALSLETLHRVVWRDLWSGEYPHLLETNLPGIGAPTLVIWGDSNRFLHDTALEKLELGLRDMRVVRMKACGHAPMLERPAEVRKHFEAFVSHLDPGAVCGSR